MECEVCNKKIKNESELVSVPGRFGSYSFEACIECAKNGYEPYEYLIYSGGFAKIALKKYPDKLPEDQIKLIRHILSFYNKTDEEYLDDCKRSVEGNANDSL